MKAIIYLFLILLSFPAIAFEKPIIPWLWQSQFRPTLRAAIEPEQLYVLAGGVGLTVYAHQQDGNVRDRYGANQQMETAVSGWGSVIGSGGPGIAIALAQLYFDEPNGWQHARALAFTSLTAITAAITVNRERPNGNRFSFPSGHTSSSFATATSLAYSYGVWVGIPAYAAATFVAASRISDDAHWFSDTLAGAALGIFWGRASAMVTRKQDGLAAHLTPVLLPGGVSLAYRVEW